jgi:hypothetical protein
MSARDMDKPLTKVETTALWHAVQWMQGVIKGWPKSEDVELRAIEVKRLQVAKRALRKVNDLRKQGL